MYNFQIPSLPFYYLRHGQTDWNKKELWQGISDIPLNAHGENQARQAATLLQQTSLYPSIGSIVSSPLQRAQRTAEIIAEAIGKPVTVIHALQEVDLGILEGEPGDTPFEAQWSRGFTPAMGESYKLFQERVALGMQKALEITPSPVLIVAHKIVYEVLRKKLDLSTDPIDNCQVIYHTPPTSNNPNWHAHVLMPPENPFVFTK